MSSSDSGIICITCGASPDLSAPRNLGEWDDAGHTDSAHRPNWSIRSFKGSEWSAHPYGSLWHAEAVYEDASGETDYNSGYADCPDVPDPLLLIPPGGGALEWTVRRTRTHPEYSGDEHDVVDQWSTFS